MQNTLPLRALEGREVTARSKGRLSGVPGQYLTSASSGFLHRPVEIWNITLIPRESVSESQMIPKARPKVRWGKIFVEKEEGDGDSHRSVQLT